MRYSDFMSTFQKLLIIVLFLLITLGSYWLYSENNQRQLNNCKYLLEQGALDKEKYPNLSKTIEKCRPLLLSP